MGHCKTFLRLASPRSPARRPFTNATPSFTRRFTSLLAFRFEAFASSYFPQESVSCSEFLRHKKYLLSPTVLKKAGIDVKTTIQRAGDAIITWPSCYHFGFNTGFNVAESTNFAIPEWIPNGKCANVCMCVPFSVRIAMDHFESLLGEYEDETGEKVKADGGEKEGATTNEPHEVTDNDVSGDDDENDTHSIHSISVSGSSGGNGSSSNVNSNVNSNGSSGGDNSNGSSGGDSSSGSSGGDSSSGSSGGSGNNANANRDSSPHSPQSVGYYAWAKERASTRRKKILDCTGNSYDRKGCSYDLSDQIAMKSLNSGITLGDFDPKGKNTVLVAQMAPKEKFNDPTI